MRHVAHRPSFIERQDIARPLPFDTTLEPGRISPRTWTAIGLLALAGAVIGGVWVVLEAASRWGSR